jgi:hypothetical protein
MTARSMRRFANPEEAREAAGLDSLAIKGRLIGEC